MAERPPDEALADHQLAARLARILSARGLAPGPTALALLADTWHKRSTVPTWQVAELAHAAGAPDPAALGLCMAASYAAAHLLDDLADEDAAPPAWARGSLDAVRLLAVARACLDDVHGLAPEARRALGRELDALQLALSDGQQADLDDRERLRGDPWALAAGKAGAGLAGYLAMAARCVVPGAEPETWRAAGQAFGELGQVCSDVADLLSERESGDWQAALPNSLLRLAVDAGCGTTVRLALAGPRPLTLAPARSAIARDEPLWEELAAGLGARQDRLRAAAAADPRLASLVARADALVEASLALRHQVRHPTAVALPPWRELRPRSLAFLGADPALREAVVTHRWGLGGRERVEADTFQRLVVIDMLRQLPDDAAAVHGELPALVERAQEWGWRYFGDLPQLSPDIDTTGLALRVLSTQGHRVPGLRAEDLTLAVETILDDPEPDGLFTTWRPHPRDRGSWRWEQARCPVATTNALVGLDSAAQQGTVGAWTPRADRALAAVLDWASGGGATSLYPEGVAEGWVLLGLVRLAGRAPAAAVRATLAGRIHQRLQRSGTLGTVLATAFGTAGLRAAQQLEVVELQTLCAALGRSQDPDGGYPADPFFPSISPGPGERPSFCPRLVGSRLVTTAVVLAALVGCENLLVGARIRQDLPR